MDDDPTTGGAVPAVLPDGVRRRLVELAATVLGELDVADTPTGLHRVRGFAPARRAAAGAVPLGVALERDAGFRQRVAAAWRAVHPELAEALETAEVPPAADPQAVLAGAYLLRRQGWEQAVAAAATALAQDGEAKSRERTQELVSRELEVARAELLRAQGEVEAARSRTVALDEELGVLRRELRRQRSDADRARASARAAEQAAQAVRAEAAQMSQRARALSEQADTAIRQAREREEHARRAVREGRALADVRARLLLDTIVDAATGLRRELALPPAGVRPADLEAPVDRGATAAAGVDDAVRARALPADDPALLERLVSLPHAHLLVDGYNVTKAAYPALPLVDQRRRLVDGLASLVARTGAEATCVFDGAEVDARPTTIVRGVRVVFSDPGLTADEKIRRMVRAEPEGRVVVVVSSDGEVVSGVRSSGARPVASTALIRLLSRT